ncbi:hypothetical protein EVJ58_g9128 [Rhodofomes roseus]|uniref:Helicase C-terminal domain-containing protein n=1 Tax=Rhodofomes roseus TaxID=34475 RepID=A0A4Y9XW28_9APHY|nr:hypothetical protein EVJ58_g9128 [Rhodofomes roseus]
MPGWTIPHSVFDIMATVPDFVTDGAWATMTGRDDDLPWVEGSVDDSWLQNGGAVLSSVRAFVDKYKVIKMVDDRHQLLTQRDNDSDGRRAILRWIKARVNVWSLRPRILAVLDDRASGSYELPGMDVANLARHYDAIAMAIFGEGALIGNNFLKPWVRVPLGRIIGEAWHREDVRINREIDMLEKEAAELDKKFDELAKNTTPRNLKSYIRRIESKICIAQKFDNTVVCTAFERQLQRVKEIGDVLKGTSEASPNLPKRFVEALALLAKQEDVAALTAEIAMLLSDEEVEPIEVNIVDEGMNFQDWGTGVEEYHNTDMDTLWAYIGRQKEKSIPFFNAKESAIGEVDPWSEQGIKEMQAPDAVPLEPRWHQLVGIIKMLDNYLAGRPTLLMDAVGVGKTMQVVGFICVLAYFHEYFAQHKKFPGKYNNITYRGAGNTPDRPNLIIVPVALEHQVLRETHRYVRPKTFDLMSYTSTVRVPGKAKSFWTVVDSFAQPPHRQIILATNTAIAADGAALYNKPTVVPTKKPWDAGPTPSSTGSGGVMIVDEIHILRSLNQKFLAVRTLRDQCGGMIGMTATPTMTTPMDLAMLGRLMDVPLFREEHFEEVDALRIALDRAKAADRKARKEAASGSKGKKKAALPSQYIETTIVVMKDYRGRWIGCIVRRTVQSQDVAGKDAAALPPMYTKYILLRLAPYEQDAINAITETMGKSLGGNSKVASDNVSISFRVHSIRFYIDLRRATFHLSQCQQGGLDFPETGEDFDANPTAKLSALLTIIKHHRTPMAPPLDIRPEYRHRPLRELPPFPEANELAPDPDFPGFTRHDGSGPDKIVIFSYFPSNNEILEILFKAKGIKAVFLNGKQSAQARSNTVKEFKDADATGPTVLVMSSVGAAGLNLAFANIIIFIDTMWSAQDCEQAEGRILRFGQSKDTFCYYLFSKGTADVNLARMAADKGVMHQAFVDANFSMKQILNGVVGFALGKILELESMELEDDDDDDDGPPTDDEEKAPQKPKPAPRKRTTKGKSAKSAIDVDEAGAEAGPSTSKPPKKKRLTKKQKAEAEAAAKAEAEAAAKAEAEAVKTAAIAAAGNATQPTASSSGAEPAASRATPPRTERVPSQPPQSGRPRPKPQNPVLAKTLAEAAQAQRADAGSTPPTRAPTPSPAPPAPLPAPAPGSTPASAPTAAPATVDSVAAQFTSTSLAGPSTPAFMPEELDEMDLDPAAAQDVAADDVDMPTEHQVPDSRDIVMRTPSPPTRASPLTTTSPSPKSPPQEAHQARPPAELLAN